jgi:hypothetical protein
LRFAQNQRQQIANSDFHTGKEKTRTKRNKVKEANKESQFVC